MDIYEHPVKIPTLLFHLPSLFPYSEQYFGNMKTFSVDFFIR